MKLILKLAVAALIANAAWRVGSSYLAFYKFKDAVTEEAQFAADKSADQLRERVVGLAQQYDIPVDRDGLTITKAEQRTRIGQLSRDDHRRRGKRAHADSGPDLDSELERPRAHPRDDRRPAADRIAGGRRRRQQPADNRIPHERR